ncbi:MAG: hypothetical protein ACI37S_07490 [Candidatus Gastranaerophilaceae bacterium]
MDMNEISDLNCLSYQADLVRAAVQVATKGQEASLVAAQTGNQELIEDTAEISEYAKQLLLAEANWT